MTTALAPAPTKPDVYVSHDMDGDTIVGIHFTLLDGTKCNAWGTRLRVQNLDEWADYVSGLQGRSELEKAWSELLTNHATHDFDAWEFAQARQMLLARDEKREKVYKEK